MCDIGEFETTWFRDMEDTHLDHFHAPVLPVLADLLTPNRKLNGYGVSEWEIKCNYFQL